MDWTITKLLDWAAGYFSQKGIDAPRLDAELLLAKVLGLPRIQLYVQFDRLLAEEELSDFKALLQRRAQREPLTYILGEKEFYSLPFKITPSVLIPRPETEGIVEVGLVHLSTLNVPTPRILDLATGSGCILISLLKNFPSARGIGVDLSHAALEIAALNAKILGVAESLQWFQHDLSQVWPESLRGPFDLMTANLPYVSETEYLQLQPEIQNYEPRDALVPGPTGLEAFEWVLPQVPLRLAPRGLALLEVGFNQGEALLQVARQCLKDFQVEVQKDLAGQDRYLYLRRISPS